eukprot:TRINITY_DN8797_c0_g1_i1.p1 TRINITY_DN8797_c0_g1~~TRINITY_DN8797_c0_g1_i1.p1  ORF type:complete len:445 (-),score=64.22 TRINITY_DN8797_c0_g1_i1:15-1349(-)
MKSSLPRRLKYGLPCLALANIGLLLWAHLCKGYCMLVDGHAPFDLVTRHVASEDNLISAVQRLAGARAWLMVTVVALMSGLWPYAKLLGTVFVVDLIDKGAIDGERGLQILEAIELAGKYSLADVFLICMNIMVFNINTGRFTVLGFSHLQVQMWMHLKSASIALIVGVTMSTALTHWAAREVASLRGRSRHSVHKYSVESVQMKMAPQTALMASLGGLLAQAMCLLLPMVHVTRSGFLGMLIQPESSRNVDISIYSMTMQLLEAARQEGEQAAVTFFMSIFLLLTVAFPLLEFFLLSLHALSSVRDTSAVSASFRRRCRVLADWSHSFNCVDVLLWVSLVTVVDLRTVVEFNIGEECRPYENIMGNKPLLSLAGLGFAASEECFLPVSELQRGWWALLAVTFLRIVIWRFGPIAEEPVSFSKAAHGLFEKPLLGKVVGMSHGV